MSYDLTIKSDDRYSRTATRAGLDSLLLQLPGVRRNGKGFALDEPQKRRMEIDLEVVNAEGDNIEETGKTYDNINCIRLHISSAFAGDSIEHDYFPTAFAIAQHVGWPLYDDQTGKRISPGSESLKKPRWRFW